VGFSVTAGPGGVDVVARLASSLFGIGAGKVTAGGGGADITPLGAGGVPRMSLRQDSTHYFDYRHTPADTLDKVDPGDLALNVAAMAVMAFDLADMEEALARPAPDSDVDPHAKSASPARPAAK